MKNSTNIRAAMMAVAAFVIAAQTGNAQQFYPATLEAESVSTNQSGNLVYQEFKTKDLITTCANEQGITDLTGLSLVYDAKADALEVVSGTNDTLVCTSLTFADVVPLSNTNGTFLQRFAWVYWETNQTANGSLVAEEQISTTPTATFSMQGELQVAVPGNGTNPPTIYVGDLRVGNPESHHKGGGHESQGGETNWNGYCSETNTWSWGTNSYCSGTNSASYHTNAPNAFGNQSGHKSKH